LKWKYGFNEWLTVMVLKGCSITELGATHQDVGGSC